MKLTTYTLAIASLVLFFITNWIGLLTDSNVFLVFWSLTIVALTMPLLRAAQNEVFHKKFGRYFTALIIVFIYIALITLPYLRGYMGQAGWRTVLANDFIALSALCWCLALGDISQRQLMNVIKLLILLTAVTFVVLLPFLDFAVVKMSDARTTKFIEEDFLGVYRVLMALSSLAPVLMLLAYSLRLKLSWRLLTGAMMFGVLAVGLYYSKRATMLDVLVAASLFFVATFLFDQGKLAARLMTAGAILCSVVLVGGLLISRDTSDGPVGVLVERLESRLDSTASVGRENVRIFESTSFFKYAPWKDRLFGKGLIGYQSYRGVPTSHIHIGWVNFVYKGGWILFGFVLVLFWRNIVSSLRYRHRPYAMVGLVLPVYYAVSFAHSTVFGGQLSVLGVGLALFLHPIIQKQMGHQGQRPRPLNHGARSSTPNLTDRDRRRGKLVGTH